MLHRAQLHCRGAFLTHAAFSQAFIQQRSPACPFRTWHCAKHGAKAVTVQRPCPQSSVGGEARRQDDVNRKLELDKCKCGEGERGREQVWG